MKRRGRTALFLFLLALLCVVFMLSKNGNGGIWEGPTLYHPLGTSGGGNDLLAMLIGSLALSTGRAILLVLVAVIVSSTLAVAIAYSSGRLLSLGFRAVVNIVESNPVVLWVFIIVIVFNDVNAILSASFAFTLAATPLLANALAGEFQRLKISEMAQNARCLGFSEWRILIHYVIPNAFPVLLPLTIHLFGAALTVFGALGMIGLSNRSAWDLGTMLLIGKENVLQNPYILVAAAFSIFLIFAVFEHISAKLLRWFAGRQ